MPGEPVAAALLLIEDNPIDAALIRTLLRREDVHWVDRLSSAITEIRERGFKEVILDLNLPDSHGIKTLETIRRIAPFLPVVIVTGVDDPELVREARRAGAADYLVKGNLNAELLTRVVQHAREQFDARAAVAATETRYRSILESLQEGFMMLDPEGRVVHVNDHFADLVGRPQSELLRRSIWDLVDPGDAEMVQRYVERRQRGLRDRYDVRMLRPDGTTVRLSVAATPLFDATGGYCGAAATFIDIDHESARVIAQREAEERFRSMVEHALIGVFTTNNTALTYANPTFASTLGYAQEELIGRTCEDVLHPSDRHFCVAETAGPMLVRFLHKDGSIVPMQVQLTATDMAGRTTVVGTARDLSEAMHDIEWKNQLAAIVESTDDAIIMADRYGLLLTWNRGAEKIFGYTREETIGRRQLHELCTPEFVEECHRLVETVRNGGHIEHYETRRRTKSGDPIEVSLTLSPIRDPAGEVVAISTIVRDVTAQKSAERQLEQNVRLSSLGRLAATIAHEFNNVLMGIQPFAEIIQRATTDERIKKAAGQIRGSVQRGKTVVEDILRFNKPQPPAVRPLHAASWLASIEPELKAVLTEQIALMIDVEPEDLQINADPAQLAQVVVNLTVNAKHAMQEGGAFTIRLRPCREGERFRFGVVANPERYALMEVGDTGSGMDAPTLERIFEPLFTTKSHGSGLGLPLAHQIIQRHGGHIFVESAPGEGTTFFIFIPREAPPPASDSAARAPAPAHANRRVLLVEDELEVAAGLETLLALEGIRSEIVHEAAGVPQAIERFAPDVILLDVTLGDASGFDVYRTIAARWPDLPVIFSTGHATEKHLENLPPGRHVALLRKPYDFQRLMAEVTKALRARR